MSEQTDKQGTAKERVLIELRALSLKHTDLVNYITASKSTDKLLYKQADIMGAYVSVLLKRIENWVEK